MAAGSSWKLSEGQPLVPGRFAIEPIGGGRWYETYLVWDDELHALAVAKLLRPDHAGDPGALRVIAAEARALDALDHPHLVRGFDAVLDGKRPHLLLELVEGPRVSTLCRRYGIVAEQLLPLALSVCAALHYMHGRGFVHLDVKPRNIVMGASPRLIDLSLARELDTARSASAPIGTDRYMAPEQCDPGRHAGEIGPASDVWGLGMTLYEALEAQLPWDRAGDRFPQLRGDPAPLRASAPRGVAETIAACLERRPEDRPTAAEVAAALEPAVDRLPAPRIGRFRPGASWRRRSGGRRGRRLAVGEPTQGGGAR